MIPRLLIAHSGMTESIAVGSDSIGPQEIADFAPLAVTLEAHELLGEVDAFVRRGLSVERVFVDLLAPAARYLGEQWDEDQIDFLDVTMGLWRLQEVLREIAARSPSELRGAFARTALFAPFPGEQHSFGTAMIDECFARAGWNTNLLIEPTRAALLGQVAERSYDLAGLTVSNDCHIGQLPALIGAIRNASKNPNIRVMVGGRVLVDNPELVQRVGADGTASSALEALEVADRLLEIPLNAAFA